MLQLPTQNDPSGSRACLTDGSPQRIPNYVRNLPDDEAALVPVYMSFSAAAKAFSLYMSADWLRTNAAGSEALEAAYDHLNDVLFYLAGRLRALPRLRDEWWQFHYTAALTEHALHTGGDANDIISAVALAHVTVCATRKGDV